jgi:hypothetical protein
VQEYMLGKAFSASGLPHLVIAAGAVSEGHVS